MSGDLRSTQTLHEANRLSWNAVTQAHNSHKSDQARYFRAGGSTLRPEELGLLGQVTGLRVVHLLCNPGQDTLSIARLGAEVTGVDISDEAIAFATRLAEDAGIAATFTRADVYDWLEAATDRQERFDIAFSSYGVVHWISDLDWWASSIAAILKPGGRFVLVDFHPAERMFSRDWSHVGDYFPRERVDALEEGVIDYGTRSPGRLSPFAYEAGIEDFRNPYPSHLFRYTLGQIVTAIGGAGLRIEALEEYPHTIAMRFNRMREIAGYRTLPPEDTPSVPLLYGLRAQGLIRLRSGFSSFLAVSWPTGEHRGATNVSGRLTRRRGGD
jgi:SAM-dependent methyltransferase